MFVMFNCLSESGGNVPKVVNTDQVIYADAIGVMTRLYLVDQKEINVKGVLDEVMATLNGVTPKEPLKTFEIPTK